MKLQGRRQSKNVETSKRMPPEAVRMIDAAVKSSKSGQTAVFPPPRTKAHKVEEAVHHAKGKRVAKALGMGDVDAKMQRAAARDRKNPPRGLKTSRNPFDRARSK